MRKVGATVDRSSHHVFYWLECGGSEYRVAKFSHSSRGQLAAIVVSDTAKRLKLTSPELNELVDCTLSGKQFRQLWVDR
jgi:hypothetical protein